MIMLKILKGARKRINQYNLENKDLKSERTYMELISSYRKQGSFVKKRGDVSKENIHHIVECLREFGIKPLRSDVSNVLSQRIENLSENLAGIRRLRLEDIDLDDNHILEDISVILEQLSKGGKDSLYAKPKRFGVGATKIMHFLLPDLMIMVDSHVQRALKEEYDFYYCHCPCRYIGTMRIYKSEIQFYESSGKDISRLISFDVSPTTIPRILDKCAYVIGEP